jgi:hypothetical protein
MPTAEHEVPVALTRLDPDFPAVLLKKLFEVKLPDYDHARSHPTDVRVMVPRTYHADGMALLCDTDDRPVLATVLEVQRGWDLAKRRTWKLYVAELEAELDVDAALLVYCPDPVISRRYRSLFAAGGLCLSLRPLIFTPDDVPLVVDEDVARASPALTVLSAVCRGDPAEMERAFPALMEALRAVGPEKEDKYYDVVLAGLPAATRTLWEKFMTTAGYEYQSEFMRNLAAKYRAEAAQEQAELTARVVASAVASTEARAILVVLEDRGVAVPDAVRHRILECTDPAQLSTWLHRVSTATTIDDVIGR